MSTDHFFSANLLNWEDRVPVHLASKTYRVDRLVSDPSWITGVVRKDREELGDVTGKTLLHLQCHIGTDTLSWAKLGAKVTGLDFSPAAVKAAQDLGRRSGLPARFVVSDVYSAPDALPETFDIVYTGVGAICWLPDIRRWAQVVARLLKPGGTFYIRDGHPVLLSLDDERKDQSLTISFPYFEGKAVKWDTQVSYTDPPGQIQHTTTYEWNHGLGETLTALIEAGLRIDSVKEYQSCAWRALPWMVQGEDGWWQLPDHHERLPLMFSIRATKVGD